MTEWTKTTRGWVLRSLPPWEINTNTTRVNTKRTINDREVSQGRTIKVSGIKNQRRISTYVCFSELIQFIDLQSAVTDIRRKEYLFDLMFLFMTKSLNTISGAAQRQLFKILESMVNEALESQQFIHKIKQLLVTTMKTMPNEVITSERIGSNLLWNRHIATVGNLCTKMEQFTLPERKDDGLACLMDLPKECIREIISKLSDHKDIVNLGQTCWDMYYMAEESNIWEKLVQYHFNEKQIDTFIGATDCLSSTCLWQDLHNKCYRKYGLKKHYADQLVICSACKALHWMMLGHHCWISDEKTQTEAWSEPVSPNELYSIFFCN
ncbi:F-box only protein 32 [Mactra antiquata]